MKCSGSWCKNDVATCCCLFLLPPSLCVQIDLHYRVFSSIRLYCGGWFTRLVKKKCFDVHVLVPWWWLLLEAPQGPPEKPQGQGGTRPWGDGSLVCLALYSNICHVFLCGATVLIWAGHKWRNFLSFWAVLVHFGEVLRDSWSSRWCLRALWWFFWTLGDSVFEMAPVVGGVLLGFGFWWF